MFARCQSIGGKTFLGVKGEVFELDAVGIDTWSLIDGENSLNTISEKIATKYAVNQEQVKNDISIFLDDLIENKLVTVK